MITVINNHLIHQIWSVLNITILIGTNSFDAQLDTFIGIQDGAINKNSIDIAQTHFTGH